MGRLTDRLNGLIAGTENAVSGAEKVVAGGVKNVVKGAKVAGEIAGAAGKALVGKDDFTNQVSKQYKSK